MRPERSLVTMAKGCCQELGIKFACGLAVPLWWCSLCPLIHVAQVLVFGSLAKPPAEYC